MVNNVEELKTENISILFNPVINNALSAAPANARYFRSPNSSFTRKAPQKTQHMKISMKLAMYSIIQKNVVIPDYPNNSLMLFSHFLFWFCLRSDARHYLM